MAPKPKAQGPRSSSLITLATAQQELTPLSTHQFTEQTLTTAGSELCPKRWAIPPPRACRHGDPDTPQRPKPSQKNQRAELSQSRSSALSAVSQQAMTSVQIQGSHRDSRRRTYNKRTNLSKPLLPSRVELKPARQRGTVCHS